MPANVDHLANIHHDDYLFTAETSIEYLRQFARVINPESAECPAGIKASRLGRLAQFLEKDVPRLNAVVQANHSLMFDPSFELLRSVHGTSIVEVDGHLGRCYFEIVARLCWRLCVELGAAKTRVPALPESQYGDAAAQLLASADLARKGNRKGNAGSLSWLREINFDRLWLLVGQEDLAARQLDDERHGFQPGQPTPLPLMEGQQDVKTIDGISEIAKLFPDSIIQLPGNEGSLSLTTNEASVIQALIELGATDLSTLKDRSGVSAPHKILAAIKEKYPSLEEFIKLPGGKARGGYSTSIVLHVAPPNASI